MPWSCSGWASSWAESPPWPWRRCSSRARRRVQAVVDRRFNRRRHDTTQIVEDFGTRLRDQVDLDTLTADLLAVVDQTMQPTKASIWLRPQAPSGTAGVTLAQQRT